MTTEIVNTLTSTAGAITAASVVFGLILAAARSARRNYQTVAAIMAELRPNGGSSLRDSINRIEALQLAGMQLTGKAYWLSNEQGECTFASTKLAALMGVAPSQVVGWGWVSSIALQDRERCRDEWDAAVRDQREFHLAYSFVHPDGTIVPVTGHAIPVVHAQTRTVIGMIGWAEAGQRSA